MFDCCLSKLTWKEVHVYEVLNTNVICKVIIIGFSTFCTKNILRKILFVPSMYNMYKYKNELQGFERYSNI